MKQPLQCWRPLPSGVPSGPGSESNGSRARQGAVATFITERALRSRERTMIRWEDFSPNRWRGRGGRTSRLAGPPRATNAASSSAFRSSHCGRNPPVAAGTYRNLICSTRPSRSRVPARSALERPRKTRTLLTRPRLRGVTRRLLQLSSGSEPRRSSVSILVWSEHRRRDGGARHPLSDHKTKNWSGVSASNGQ